LGGAVDGVDFERALAECASEPIHTPQATQSFGVAVIVDATTQITHVSASSELHLGVAPDALLGKRVRDVLEGQLEAPWSRVSALRHDRVANFGVPLAGKSFDVGGWLRADGAAVLSLVPTDEPPPSSFMEEFGELRRQLGESHSLQELCDRTARALRDLSGYDRVMVYRFDAEGNGAVVSEARRQDLEPYLGLHYPASDIPAQARTLYLRTRTRVLGDTLSPAVALLAVDPSMPLADLSMSLVRAHSPVHVKYLENMGTRATLVVSIVTTDGRLWGLVACHHLAPRVPSARVRLLSELLSDVIALRIQLHEGSEIREADQHAAEAHHDMLRLLARAGSRWVEGIASPEASPRLTELVPSGGAALVRGTIAWLVGETPPAEVIAQLPAVLRPRLVEDVYHTSRVLDFGPLARHQDVASGLVAVRLRADDDLWLFWFRPEQTRTVTWAGDSRKSLVVEQGTARLSPRQSFAAWTEEQRGCAEPWRAVDLARARRIRDSISDFILRLSVITRQSAQLELLRRACEAAGQPLAVLDPTGRPIFVNEAWTFLFGAIEPEMRVDRQLAARCVDTTLHGALLEILAGRLCNHVGETDLVSGELSTRILVNIDGMLTEEGMPAGAVIVVSDLTARIQAEEERRQLDARLERADRLEALALVTGSVAHDFNNLLTGILCETSLLADERSSGDELHAGLGEIEQIARRAADLCKQLLAYSGKGTFVVRRTDLVALARDLVIVLAPVIPRGREIVIRAAVPSALVIVDAVQIRQVMMNLIINACDASGDGAPPVELVIETERREVPEIFGSATEPVPPGDYVVLRVRDHGAGIPEPALSRIFEPFFTTKREGKGLGLAMVLGTVRSHRGVVAVESRIGAGTSISVWLPAAPALVEPTPVAAPRRAGGTHILVVEDEPQARALARRILEREGYVVLTAETLEAARQLLEDPSADVALVFTDLRLPDGSGREVIAAALARDPALPVILTSGLNDQLEPLSAETPNLVAFLPKPYDRAQLATCLAEGLRRSTASLSPPRT
jgi:light-regulated signal transduction histidine kinase (bacteriophytochrome)/ActR/RegA family two-component response regulator